MSKAACGVSESPPPNNLGPGRAAGGTRCAGTVLDGSYDPTVDTRLVSPPFIVPCFETNPRLRYAHWHNLGAGDWAAVEMRLLPDGGWSTVGDVHRGASGDWTTGFLDLAPYAEKRVQLAFRLKANGDASVGPGWYLDEVRLQANVADPLPDRRVTEGDLLSFQVTAACGTAKFRLDDDAPAGARIHRDFGIFTWQPDACQGPGVYDVRIILADPTWDLPVACLTQRIEVLDVNHPPLFGSIPPLAILPGVPVLFRAGDYAYDPSCPVQQLTYTLDPGSPVGATLHPVTGELTWIPTLEQAARSNPIHLRVTDNGQPPQSTTTTVLAYVQPTVRISHLALVNGQLAFTLEGGAPGQRFDVLSAPSPMTPHTQWEVLPPPFTWPTTGPASFQIPLGPEAARFFRLRFAPQ